MQFHEKAIIASHFDDEIISDLIERTRTWWKQPLIIQTANNNNDANRET